MISAKRVSDGAIVNAYFENKGNGPFRCVTCKEEVLLRSGRKVADHFAHANPFACENAVSESDEHLRCKIEIFKAHQNEPGVTDVMLERPCGRVRPDVSAIIRGVKVAIEVQISALSIERIMERTIAYHQKGIYVLWLLIWTPELDKERYAPSDLGKVDSRLLFWSRFLPDTGDPKIGGRSILFEILAHSFDIGGKEEE